VLLSLLLLALLGISEVICVKYRRNGQLAELMDVRVC